jgi:hypothetical protein
MAEIKAPEWPGESNLHQRARPHTTIYSSAPSRRSRSRARPPYGLLDHLIRPLQERLGDRQAEGLGGPEIDHQLERPERLTLTLHVRRRSRSSSTAATKSCTLIGLPWYASNPAPNLLPVLAHHGRGRPCPRRDLETPRMGDKWSSDSRAIRRVSASSAAQDACHWTAARPCSRITDSPPIW